MKHIITCLLIVVYLPAFAQVSGRLQDTSGQPVPFVAIVILDNTNNALISSALSDDKGMFKLLQVTAGKYIVKVSGLTYETWTSAAFELTATNIAVDLGIIELKASSKQLNEVVIRADKPLVQQEAGGMVVNVQNSVLTKGSSVLQVLQRLPGVIINTQNNDISLNGKNGVMVMLDGKLMRISLQQLITLLNGMNADDIEKVELLTTPPARYDADGNAGLINIISKKNRKRGTNGSLTATAGYGRYEKASAGVDLNRNTGKVNLH
ncbi:MAG TPA: TonB-dependent receptor, partial [Mucilaginibacter sp.]